MFWKLLLDRGKDSSLFHFSCSESSTSMRKRMAHLCMVYTRYLIVWKVNSKNHPQEMTLVSTAMRVLVIIQQPSSSNALCVCSDAQECLTLCGPMPARLLYPWNVPGKNTGASCHFLLQGIFPTQRSNP